jgi:hypothetical protein
MRRGGAIGARTVGGDGRGRGNMECGDYNGCALMSISIMVACLFCLMGVGVSPTRSAHLAEIMSDVPRRPLRISRYGGTAD